MTPEETTVAAATTEVVARDTAHVDKKAECWRREEPKTMVSLGESGRRPEAEGRKIRMRRVEERRRRG